MQFGPFELVLLVPVKSLAPISEAFLLAPGEHHTPISIQRRLQPVGAGDLQMLSPEYPHALRAELGMPLDTHLVIFSIKDLPNCLGYTYEFVGVQEQYTFVSGHAEPTSPPEAPRFQLFVPGPQRLVPIPLIAWRRRVYHEGSALYLEARWCPETEETNAVVWPPALPLKTVHKHSTTMIKLLQKVERRGRREKPEGFESYEEAIAVMVDIVRQLKREKKLHRQQDVAGYLLYKTTRFPLSNTQEENEAHTARRLRNYCKHEGLTWDDIERMASN